MRHMRICKSTQEMINCFAARGIKIAFSFVLTHFEDLPRSDYPIVQGVDNMKDVRPLEGHLTIFWAVVVKVGPVNTLSIYTTW